jgi:CheY-like chemotaxis protein
MKTANKISGKQRIAPDVVWYAEAGKFDSKLTDISMDGCFIESVGQEEFGETINFNVEMPSGVWLTLQGVVTEQEPGAGFKMHFATPTRRNQKLLQQVVTAHGNRRSQEAGKESNDGSAEIFAGTTRYLAADDNPVTLAVIKAIIETLGGEVVCASDGREAAEILQNDSKFSAVIFDMMMPYLSGVDLIHFVKSDARLNHIPIAMITADRDPKIWDDSVAAGASVFLPKPFTPPQFETMLRLLDHSPAAKQIAQGRT